MAKHVMLNNVAHKNLRVKRGYSGEFGDSVHAVPVFPTELGDVQREYPILFRRDPQTGQYGCVALLGFAPGENLFLGGGHWNASYVPAIVARGPFLIGFQEREHGGELHREPVIHVDMDDPRLSETEGEPVFLPHGGNTPYLDRIARILNAIQEGMAVTPAMFAAFEEHGLIDAVDLQIDLHTDEQNVLTGFHSINRDKLAKLPGDVLEKLNRAGFLLGAFLVVASLTNVGKMIDIKNRRTLEGRKAASRAAP